MIESAIKLAGKIVDFFSAKRKNLILKDAIKTRNKITKLQEEVERREDIKDSELSNNHSDFKRLYYDYHRESND